MTGGMELAQKSVTEAAATRAAEKAVKVAGWCHHTVVKFEPGLSGPGFDGWVVEMYGPQNSFLGLL